MAMASKSLSIRLRAQCLANKLLQMLESVFVFFLKQNELIQTNKLKTYLNTSRHYKHLRHASSGGIKSLSYPQVRCRECFFFFFFIYLFFVYIIEVCAS